MNTFTSNEESALLMHKEDGRAKRLTMAWLLFFSSGVVFDLIYYKGIPDLKLGPGSEFYLCIGAILWGLFYGTRKVETYFFKESGVVERIFCVYGIKTKRLFKIQEISLLSKTKESRYSEWDNLYIVNSKGKEYFIGQSHPWEEDAVSIVAGNIVRFCGLNYDHDF